MFNNAASIQPAETRTRRQQFVDAAAEKLLRLPPSTTDYTVARGIPIRMRDGVELQGDHYAPTTTKERGTILVRCPYGRSVPYSLFFARVYAARGYHVLLQSCRGTFGSGGAFEPMLHEINDAADTVAWLREQPWFAGRIATVGLSYLGFTQWALLMDPPPELVTSVIVVGPHDFSRAAYGTGAFALNDFLAWSDVVVGQEERGAVRALLRLATATRRLARPLNKTPLIDAGEQLFEGRAPWYSEWAARTDVSDPYWETMQLAAALDRVETPVLLIGGWQDLFLDQTLTQYDHLQHRGLDVALTVGPWTHLDIMGKGAPEVTRETLDWLDEHLAGTGTRKRAEAVRVFATGADEWRHLPLWPPVSTERTLFLYPGGGLDTIPPHREHLTATFTYDPAHPTPTVGGRLLSAAGGYRDDTSLGQRPDVLTFTGPVLSEALEVFGVPVVKLAHTTDNPHADLFVRLCEVDTKGRSHNVSDGFVRLGQEAVNGVVRLELDATAHRFAAGNRLRLVIAGGSHPRWDRNLGTGENPATGTTMKPSRHTIDCMGSHLYLPVQC